MRQRSARWTIWCLVIAAAIAAAITVYRFAQGDSFLSLVIGFLAVTMGVFVIGFFAPDPGRRYTKF